MKNELLRHIISTIKYHFEESISGSHQAFGDFSLGKDSRSPKDKSAVNERVLGTLVMWDLAIAWYNISIILIALPSAILGGKLF